MLDEIPAEDVPCGGLGGNEWSKITYSYSAGAGLVKDADASLARAVAALEALDVEHVGQTEGTTGPRVSFHGRGYDGEVVVRESGALQVRASTDCLDNPER